MCRHSTVSVLNKKYLKDKELWGTVVRKLFGK
jgi:hypothetical protein